MHHLLHTGQFVGSESMEDLNNLSSFLDEKLKEIKQRIDWMQAQEVVQNVGALATSAREYP